jgi:hypothetical protein
MNRRVLGRIVGGFLPILVVAYLVGGWLAVRDVVAAAALVGGVLVMLSGLMYWE